MHQRLLGATQDLNAWGRPINGARRDRFVYAFTALLGSLSVAQAYVAMTFIYWGTEPAKDSGILFTLLVFAISTLYGNRLYRQLSSDRAGILRLGGIVGFLIPLLAGLPNGFQLIRESVWLPELHWVGATICSFWFAVGFFLGHAFASLLCSKVRRAQAMDRRELWGQGMGLLMLCFGSSLMLFRHLGGPGIEDHLMLRVSEWVSISCGGLLFGASLFTSLCRRVWGRVGIGRNRNAFELCELSVVLGSDRIFATSLSGKYHHVLYRKTNDSFEAVGRL